MKDELDERLEQDAEKNQEQVSENAAGEVRGPELTGQEKTLEEQKNQIADLNDKFLRTLAEFDNYRKRTLKERVELIQTASADLILSLLPVLDDFERAIQAYEQCQDQNALKEGIVLVQQKFRNVLNQKGLEEMKSIGTTFDTDMHEAVANVPAAAEEEKNLVMDEVQKGYLLNGKVLRFAKVVVAN